MNLTIERHALLAALTPVVRVTERRNTIPILANVVMTTIGNTLQLKATDLDIEITHSAPLAYGTDGVTTTNARMLLDIVKRLSDGSQVNMDANDRELVVKAGRSTFKIGVLSADSYPVWGAQTFTTTVNIAEPTLSKMIGHVVWSISSDETRYYLNGALFSHGDIVTTDGHKLSHASFDGDFGEGVIIHRKALGEIASLCGDGEVTAEFSSEKARFTFSSGVVLTTKLIDGTYPDWGRIMPRSFEQEMLADHDAMVDALGRIQAVQGKSSRGTKLAMADGRLVMSLNAEGEASEELSVEYESDPLEIGINSRFLTDAVSVCEGNIRFRFNGDGGPVLISGDDPSIEVVVMPMRV